MNYCSTRQSLITCLLYHLVSMNTTVTRSTNKTPYEIVFGQKPNTFHNALISVPSINLQDIEDIVEDEGEETTPVQFAVSPRERTAANTSLIESDSKRIRSSNYNIHHSNNIVNDEAFEVTCPIREDIRQKVSENLNKSRDKMELRYNTKKKHAQANTLSAIMSRYSYQIDTDTRVT